MPRSKQILKRSVPARLSSAASLTPVSYTHLDVYKRQIYGHTVSYPPSRFLQEVPRNLVTVFKRPALERRTINMVEAKPVSYTHLQLGRDIDAKTNIYIKADLLHEFGGGYDVKMTAANGDGLYQSADFDDTWVE